MDPNEQEKTAFHFLLLTVKYVESIFVMTVLLTYIYFFRG